ncbi:MAG: hypothetical protein QNK37_00145 [Acidobacteriota bacterium]|nr:hypothetical protein [Acidobacteriota bacterium]
MILLLWLISQSIEGQLYSEYGHWRRGNPWISNTVLIIPAKDRCFLIEDNHLPRVIEGPFASVLSAVKAGNRFWVADTEGLYIFNENLDLEWSSQDKYYQLSVMNDDRVLGVIIPNLKRSYPKLLYDFGSKRHLFRKPSHAPALKAWITVKQGRLFALWSGIPDKIFAVTPEIDRRNADAATPGHYPYFVIPGVTPPSPAGKPTYPLAEKPFMKRQELVYSPTPVFFGAMSRGWVICYEVGVKAPGMKPTLYIGSKIEARFIDDQGKLIATKITHGQIAGIVEDQLIILHNGRITPSPLTRWTQQDIPPYERARELLSDFKLRKYRTWHIYLERWNWPEAPR